MIFFAQNPLTFPQKSTRLLPEVEPHPSATFKPFPFNFTLTNKQWKSQHWVIYFLFKNFNSERLLIVGPFNSLRVENPPVICKGSWRSQTNFVHLERTKGRRPLRQWERVENWVSSCLLAGPSTLRFLFFNDQLFQLIFLSKFWVRKINLISFMSVEFFRILLLLTQFYFLLPVPAPKMLKI